MATWQKARVIRFRSAAIILDTFGLPKDGRYYKRLVAGFERIFYATFFFASDEQQAETVVITRTSFRFVKDLRLWFVREGSADQHPGTSRRENVIVLSEEFWREIQQHPIPVDLSVVRALADSPGNLDLYIWLVWRSWTARGSASIPLFGPEGLISQLGISDRLRERDFRRQILVWLKMIHQLWPDCPAIVAEPGTSLLIRSAGKLKHPQQP
jgi:Plasmid encoded RepA protein